LAVYKEINKSIAEGIPGVLITMVTIYSGTGVLINRYWMTADSRPVLPSEFMEKIEPEVTMILSLSDPENFKRMELSVPGEEPSHLFFLEPVFPLPKLVIAGAGHIGKALSHIGKMLDFEITVIDDRKEYANPDNIPDADHIIVRDIGEAIREMKKTPETFIVIVTRGHNADSIALKACIGKGAAYIGMIGSRSKIEKMKAEFIQKKWTTKEQWSNIYAPVGLDIKSKTVEEIAVSIAAQLVLVRNISR